MYLFIALVLHYLYPFTIIEYPLTLIGILIAAGALALMAWAILLFKKKKTPKHPYKQPLVLVTSGPFRFTRNPMYVGLGLLSLGVAFLVGSGYLFVAPVAFWLTMNFTFIPREEKICEKVFGKKYLDYKKKVGRWL